MKNSDPWSNTFRSPSPDSDDSDDEPTGGYRPSREAQLAKELQERETEDKAIFKPTPFTTAQVQARRAKIAAANGYGPSQNQSKAASNAPVKRKGPVPAGMKLGEDDPEEMGAGTKKKGPVPAFPQPEGRPYQRETDSVWKTGKNEVIPLAVIPKKPAPPKTKQTTLTKSNIASSSTAAGKKQAIETREVTPPLEKLLKKIDEEGAKVRLEEEKKEKEKEEKKAAKANKATKPKPKPKPKAKGKGKNQFVDDEAEEEEAPKKKGGGRKKKSAEDDITFTRIPAGAGEDSDYPIVKGLKKQKDLPTKKASTAKAKGKAKATTSKKPTSKEILSDSSISDDEPITRTIDDFFTDLIPLSKPKAKNREDKKIQEEIDELDSYSEDEDEKRIKKQEAQGKAEVMKKFLGTSSSEHTKVSDPSLKAQTTKITPNIIDIDEIDDDQPSTITQVDLDIEIRRNPKQPPKAISVDDTSSQLPYSSPLEVKARNLHRENSDHIVRPKPVKYKETNKLAALAGMGDSDIEEAMKLEYPKKTAGLLDFPPPQAPRFTSKSYKRPASPRSQIQMLGHAPQPPSKKYRRPNDYNSLNQATPPTRVASPRLFPHTKPVDPYAHPSFDQNEGWSILKKRNKWQPPPRNIPVNPDIFDRNNMHFRGGGNAPFRNTATNSSTSNVKRQRPPSSSSPSPEPQPESVGKFRLTTLWTPSAPAKAPPPREMYTMETIKGNQYGASRRDDGVEERYNRSNSAYGNQGLPEAPAQPVFRGANRRGGSQYDNGASGLNHHNSNKTQDLENWEDAWKRPSAAQPRLTPSYAPTTYDQQPRHTDNYVPQDLPREWRTDYNNTNTNADNYYSSQNNSQSQSYHTSHHTNNYHDDYQNSQAQTFAPRRQDTQPLEQFKFQPARSPVIPSFLARARAPSNLFGR